MAQNSKKRSCSVSWKRKKQRKKKRKKEKKTEHTIISHISSSRVHQNIHVMLVYAKKKPRKTKKKQKGVWKKQQHAFINFSFFGTAYIFWLKKEKNGAHNHLSHISEFRASKYSRHVVLCKKIQHKKKQITKEVC